MRRLSCSRSHPHLGLELHDEVLLKRGVLVIITTEESSIGLGKVLKEGLVGDGNELVHVLESLLLVLGGVGDLLVVGEELNKPGDGSEKSRPGVGRSDGVE